jgi:hypothetical protein
MPKRSREYIVSDILYDVKILMGKDCDGNERVLNKEQSKNVLDIDLGEAFASIHCEEFNEHLYYHGVYWGSSQFNRLIENYVGLYIEWYDSCIALLYMDD